MLKQAPKLCSVCKRAGMVVTSGVWKVTGLRLGCASRPESELATSLRWRPTGATAETQSRAGSKNRDSGQVQAASKTERHSEPTRPGPQGTGETASEHHRCGEFLSRGEQHSLNLSIEFLAHSDQYGDPPVAFKLAIL